MKTQLTFSDMEYGKRKRVSRRELFLKKMKEFVKIDFWEEEAPDATALSGFRHLIEENRLQQKLFERINGILEREGMIRHGGSIAGAAIAEAPGSTKNSGKSRDPEMAQTKKGNGWHFGMKAHIGADAGTGMAHSVSCTAANWYGKMTALSTGTPAIWG